MNDFIVMILRVLHIFASVAWVGATWMIVFFVEPTARALGPEGGKFMNYMGTTRRYPLYIMVAAATTLIAGILLFGMKWGPVWNTPRGLAFLIGGLFGIAGGIVGGMTGGVTGRMTKLGGAMAQQGKPPSPEQLAEMGKLQERLRLYARITAVLTSIALFLMAIARYVPQ